MKSLNITIADKTKILEHFDEDLDTVNKESLKQMILMLNAHSGFNPSPNLIDEALLSSSNNGTQRIKVLLDRNEGERVFLETFLSSLGGKYVQIIDRSKRLTFTMNDLNVNFFRLLKDRV